jgi:hypothetical protein
MAGRWIGRRGLIAWPPRSPDLTPLDLFLWGYGKNIVYQVKINHLRRPKTYMRTAGATVTPNVLQANAERIEYHLDICLLTKGAHIDIY